MNKITTLSMALPGPPADAGDVKNYDDVGVLKAWTRCAVYAIEVPLDEAVVPEVADRLAYVYGFDCYARWRAAAAISFPSLWSESD